MMEDKQMEDKRWGEEQTKFMLDKYGEYLGQVGPMKSLRTKRNMWEKIKSDMEEQGNVKIYYSIVISF